MTVNRVTLNVVKSLNKIVKEILHPCRVQNDVNPLFKEDASSRRVKSHTALDAFSIPLLGRGQGEGLSRRELFVMLNLFQHLTSLACRLLLGKILKQVQDDNKSNKICNNFPFSTFNSSTLQEGWVRAIPKGGTPC